MKAKKIIFVLVEGVSDKTALGSAFEKVFSNDLVIVEVAYGDITSKSGVTPDNILKNIADRYLKDYAGKMKLKQSDFKEMVHIIDMDGAYIPDDKIFYNENCESFLYSTENIQSNNVDAVKSRNNKKRCNIEKLIGTGKVWKTIPYRCYYMSCNLEHVLFNKLNCCNKEKEKLSYEFEEKYRQDPEGFKNFICKSDFSVIDSFNGSWNFIKEDTNSLKRHTNLGLSFDT